MMKKHNIFLFIILILLICFCLFNRSLMENLENTDTENSNCNKPTKHQYPGSGKSSIKAFRSSHVTHSKISKDIGCIGLSQNSEIINNINMAEQKVK